MQNWARGSNTVILKTFYLIYIAFFRDKRVGGEQVYSSDDLVYVYSGDIRFETGVINNECSKEHCCKNSVWAAQVCAVSVDTNASYLFAADFIPPPLVCKGERERKKEKEHGNSRNRRSCVFSYLSAGCRIEVSHLAAP
jgi:hypothetical protein